MAGRPGRSGGWNKLSLEQHKIRGTVNVTRHQPRPAIVPATVPCVEPVPADLTAGLSARGRDFVVACWEAYTGWTPTARALLIEAGWLIEQVDGLRGQRGERAAQRLLLSTLAALNLREE